MKIRAYGRTELAMMYCPQDTPGAAWRKLRQWTEHCPDLLRRLQDLGYTYIHTGTSQMDLLLSWRAITDSSPVAF